MGSGTQQDPSTSEGLLSTVPEPERRQHPVVAGLVALVGVGLAIGLLAGGGTLVATRVLGLGSGATAVDSTARQCMYLPKPEKTTATWSAAGRPTQRRGQRAHGPGPHDAQPRRPSITLQPGQTQVGPMGRIDLTGTYPTGEGACCRCSARPAPATTGSTSP